MAHTLAMDTKVADGYRLLMSTASRSGGGHPGSHKEREYESNG